MTSLRGRSIAAGFVLGARVDREIAVGAFDAVTVSPRRNSSS